MAGYSGTPLVRKLGIRPGHRVTLRAAPTGFQTVLKSLSDDVVIGRGRRASTDVVLQFAEWRRPLAKEFCKAQALLHPAGALWVCWPKRAAKRPTDLTEAVVRTVGLDHGLVDVKVCAVDEVWSGLKFVYRLRDRPKQR
jgi:hypothetical protein